jgi:hypothetical protein
VIISLIFPFLPFTYLIGESCFPHVVNLACKAVLKAITNLNYAIEDVNEFVPEGPLATMFTDAIDRDPIATVRSIVRSVRPYDLFILLHYTILIYLGTSIFPSTAVFFCNP